MFGSVLVANRGEIARRVIRTLHALGIRSVAVYTDADAGAPHVREADEAVRIGSYLSIEDVIEAARGCDALHPGYGFLSENAGLARACAEAGVVFVGPSPEAIELMGDKVRAKEAADAAGVPVVESLSVEAARASDAYPLLVKAAAGGGGRGMRIVDSPDGLDEAIAAAQREAAAGFGDDRVFIERFLPRARHIEVQVIGDTHGTVLSLGERECSLQRRHQKVVEEAPSPVVTPELRRRMGEAAVKAASAVGYSNAGTCEFLLASDGSFYFLEMNTRLQVEHPVTELVTGIDLVQAQIRVAEGEPLGPVFDDVQPRGHAVEVRLYAEDPWNRFTPSPGRIERLRWPEGPGVRNDAGVYEGSEVSIHYDPMLAKLIVWAADRPRALQKLDRALSELRVEGIRTNISLFKALLADPDFLAGNMDIGMLDRKLASGELRPAAEDEHPDLPLLAAALAHYERASRTATGGESGRRNRWGQAGRLQSLRGGSWS
jgi:acetyl/propionyl-CoA carboxylase alpha subunit